MSYYVYILKCADGSYYTGITNDVAARILEHNAGRAAAKYTRSRRPVQLVYTETCPDRGAALQREYALKRLSRSEKEHIIDAGAR